MVISEILKYGEENLSKNQYTDAKSESRRILSFLLNRDESFVLTNLDYEIDESTEKKFKAVIERRKNHEPIQYIFNRAHFYGREFYVDRGALIPRWDSENLIEVVKDICKKEEPEILEIGCGSGAVSITLGMEIENAKVLGVDISRDALRVSNVNLEKYKLSNVKFYKSDLFKNIYSTYDIIISNPPYIKTEEMKNLQEEVKREPASALDGGMDGLEFYRNIIDEAYDFLNEDGYIVFEIGYDQFEPVKNLLISNGFKNIRYKRDLQGYKRVIYAERGE